MSNLLSNVSDTALSIAVLSKALITGAVNVSITQEPYVVIVSGISQTLRC